LLDGPQLLVAQHGLERVQVGIGAQHEDRTLNSQYSR
jgi:hypothetical protein